MYQAQLEQQQQRLAQQAADMINARQAREAKELTRQEVEAYCGANPLSPPPKVTLDDRFLPAEATEAEHDTLSQNMSAGWKAERLHHHETSARNILLFRCRFSNELGNISALLQQAIIDDLIPRYQARAATFSEPLAAATTAWQNSRQAPGLQHFPTFAENSPFLQQIDAVLRQRPTLTRLAKEFFFGYTNLTNAQTDLQTLKIILTENANIPKGTDRPTLARTIWDKITAAQAASTETKPNIFQRLFGLFFFWVQPDISVSSFYNTSHAVITAFEQQYTQEIGTAKAAVEKIQGKQEADLSRVENLTQKHTELQPAADQERAEKATLLAFFDKKAEPTSRPHSPSFR